MANTLKFGNGQWATGNGTALAYNDENSNFKPLPFDFTRASSGTTVNQSGLIETVGSGIPRIDFQGNTEGALLLEPSRTNSITYSEDFSNAAWTKSGTSVVSGFASPSADSPLGAFKLVENTANSAHTITSNVGSVSSGATTTKSIIVKPNGRRWVLILDIYKPGSRAWFDLELGVVGSRQPSAISSSIEKLSNGYFRCSVVSAVNGASSQLRMDIVEGNNVTTGYQGDGTSGVYIFGAQLEVGSYATSYIPTSGSAVTRVADTCRQTVPDGVIGQTEGTMFIEAENNPIAYLFDTPNNVIFGSINSGNYLNNFHFTTDASNIYVYCNSGGTLYAAIGTNLPSSSILKMAVTYTSSAIKFFLNGVLVGTDTSLNLPIGMNQIDVGNLNQQPTTQKMRGGINKLILFDKEITESEAIALTQV